MKKCKNEGRWLNFAILYLATLILHFPINGNCQSLLDGFDDSMVGMGNLEKIQHDPFNKKYRVSVNKINNDNVDKNNDDIYALIKLKSSNTKNSISVMQKSFLLPEQSGNRGYLTASAGQKFKQIDQGNANSFINVDLLADGWKLPISLYSYNELWVDYEINLPKFATCLPVVRMEGLEKPFGKNVMGSTWSGESESIYSPVVLDGIELISGEKKWHDIALSRLKKNPFLDIFDHEWKISDEKDVNAQSISRLSKSLNMRLNDPEFIVIKLNKRFPVNYVELKVDENSIFSTRSIKIPFENLNYIEDRDNKIYRINLREEINKRFSNILKNNKNFKNGIFIKNFVLGISSNSEDLTQQKPDLRIEMQSRDPKSEILPQVTSAAGSMLKRMVVSLDRSPEKGELILTDLKLRLHNQIVDQSCSIKINAISLNRSKREAQIPNYLDLINEWLQRLGVGAAENLNNLNDSVLVPNIVQYIPLFQKVDGSQVLRFNRSFEVGENTHLFIGESPGFERSNFFRLLIGLREGGIVERRVKANESIPLGLGRQKIESISLDVPGHNEKQLELREIVFYDLMKREKFKSLETILPWASEIPISFIAEKHNNSLVFKNGMASGAIKSREIIEFRTDIAKGLNQVFAIKVSYDLGLKIYKDNACPVIARLIYDNGVTEENICPSSGVGNNLILANQFGNQSRGGYGQLKSIVWKINGGEGLDGAQSNFRLHIIASGWKIESIKEHINSASIIRINNELIESVSLADEKKISNAEFPIYLKAFLPKNTIFLLDGNNGHLEVDSKNTLYELVFPAKNTYLEPGVGMLVNEGYDYKNNKNVEKPYNSSDDKNYLKYSTLFTLFILINLIIYKTACFRPLIAKYFDGKNINILAIKPCIQVIFKYLAIISSILYITGVLFLINSIIGQFSNNRFILIVFLIQVYIYLAYELIYIWIFGKAHTKVMNIIYIFNICISFLLAGWILGISDKDVVNYFSLLLPVSIILYNLPGKFYFSNKYYYVFATLLILWVTLLIFGFSRDYSIKENYYLTVAGFTGTGAFIALLKYLNEKLYLQNCFSNWGQAGWRISGMTLVGIFSFAAGGIAQILFFEKLAEQFILIGYICFVLSVIQTLYMYLKKRYKGHEN